MNYVRVEGHKDFVRDKRSGAIINTNKEEIEGRGIEWIETY